MEVGEEVQVVIGEEEEGGVEAGEGGPEGAGEPEGAEKARGVCEESVIVLLIVYR